MPSLCGLACMAGGGAGAPGKSSCLGYTPLCHLHSRAAVNPAPYGSGVRVGSELSSSQRCWGSGCPPGSCPTKGPGRGGIGRGRRFPWELDGRHHVQHAGMGFPASRGLFLVCSPLLPPRQHPQTPGSYFPFTFTSSSPPQPQSPRSNNEEPGALPFPKRISHPNACQGVLGGCRGPSSAPRRSRPGAPFLAVGEEGDGITPRARSCPSGALRVHGLSPALSHPPGKCCGKCWLLLLNKLYRGLLRFNQSLVIRGVLSCCSDPVPLLDLRAGAQASPPAPASLSRFPFPFHSRRCHFSLLQSVTAKPGIYRPSLTQRCSKILSPSSLPSLPPTPAQDKIDQCIFIDGLNTRKEKKKRDVAIETSIKLPSPLRDASAAPASPEPVAFGGVGVKKDWRWVWGCPGWGGCMGSPTPSATGFVGRCCGPHGARWLPQQGCRGRKMPFLSFALAAGAVLVQGPNPGIICIPANPESLLFCTRGAVTHA